MENGNSGEFLKGIFIGGIIGSVVAILYAPKSGRETRDDLNRRANDLMEKGKQELDTAVDKSKRSYESAVTRLHELEEMAKKKIDEVEAQLHELTSKSKRAVDDGRYRVKKAFEAGVDAYKEEKQGPQEPVTPETNLGE
ncbi:MAG: YtxH domain-containing protein [Calditrichia bacterium]